MAIMKTNTIYFGKKDEDILEHISTLNESFSSYVRRLIREDLERSLVATDSKTRFKESYKGFDDAELTLKASKLVYRNDRYYQEEHLSKEESKEKLEIQDNNSEIYDYIDKRFESMLERILGSESMNNIIKNKIDSILTQQVPSKAIYSESDNKKLDTDDMVLTTYDDNSHKEHDNKINYTEPKVNSILDSADNNDIENNDIENNDIENNDIENNASTYDYFSVLENNSPIMDLEKDELHNISASNSKRNRMKDITNLITGQLE